MDNTVGIRFYNYDHYITKDIINKPITWGDETIGKLEYADDQYLHGRIQSKYVNQLMTITSISMEVNHE